MDDHVAKISNAHADALEYFLADTIRVRVTSKARVTFRRPWWLPAPVYRWLWRSVVLETSTPTVEVDRG